MYVYIYIYIYIYVYIHTYILIGDSPLIRLAEKLLREMDLQEHKKKKMTKMTKMKKIIEKQLKKTNMGRLVII